MIERTCGIDRAATAIMVMGLAAISGPMVIVVVTASQSYQAFLRHSFSMVPGGSLWDNVLAVWHTTDLPIQIFNSLVVGAVSSAGRVGLAFVTAFGIVFFAARYRILLYALVLVTIMLPLELMVITAYQVASNVAMPLNALANLGGGWAALTGAPLDLQWNILDSYAGLTLPLMAQGSVTLILVQFMRSIPEQLARAATMDGAGPLRFLWDILLPLCRGPVIAMFLYQFIDGWVQFMWPLVAVNSPEKQVAVVGLTQLGEQMPDKIPNYPLQMTGALMVTLLPLLLIALFQRHIVRGLTLTEK